MSKPIEDYALLGDLQTAALVAKDGAIDWLCLPRFDSDACFAALLGDEEHGTWALAPVDDVLATNRRYRPGSLVLETDVRTATGRVRIVDCMPPRRRVPDVVRIVTGLEGTVRVRMRLSPRFGYGAQRPWVVRTPAGCRMIAGPDALELRTRVPLSLQDGTATASIEVAAGQEIAFALAWHPSHEEPPPPVAPSVQVAEADAWWHAWSSRCSAPSPWAQDTRDSLVVLKGLTYGPTGGIVAAATTSLPEEIGGKRNWDYRFCWLRDATFVLDAFLDAGYQEEAIAWREWLLRAVAGAPEELQIVYGVDGSRRLTELALPWLPGYERSRPVRIGNAAKDQLQLDVFGEVLDLMHEARRFGVEPDASAIAILRALVEHLEGAWNRPDAGIWEVRGPPRHFTHSKVMAWVAFDRAVQAVEASRMEGPVERWRVLRDRLHAEICRAGWNAERRSFVQYYGGERVDASLLLLPAVGFLPARDARVLGTIAAVERELVHDGLVLRYLPDEHVEGVEGHEGTFLACTFWLADAFAMTGRLEEARRTFQRLLSLRNDVGLLAEEYDVSRGRMVGNFPQAYSHVSLVNTAQNLTSAAGPAHRRGAPSAALAREDAAPT